MSWSRMVAVAVLAGCACACGEPPKVVQGKVVSYAPESKNLVVADELAPHDELALSVEKADIGADPRPDDVVRISYRERDGSLVALRVMNITRQNDLKSSGGH